jgi:hypothetical protein
MTTSSKSQAPPTGCASPPAFSRAPALCDAPLATTRTTYLATQKRSGITQLYVLIAMATCSGWLLRAGILLRRAAWDVTCRSGAQMTSCTQ